VAAEKESSQEAETVGTEFEGPVAISTDQCIDLSGGQHHVVEPPNEVIHQAQPAAETADPQAAVLEELQGLKLAHHQRLPSEESKEVIARAGDDDELFRRDFDASTTTNTDGEE
jgi:hypothetical protein